MDLRKRKSKEKSRKRTKKRWPTESVFTGKIRPRKIEADGKILGQHNPVVYWDWEITPAGRPEEELW